MSENSPTAEDLKKDMSLKLTEPEILVDDIWADDALDRSTVAHSLTNLVRDQANPFVISLNGHWGTGKTFFLKRWQQQLKQDGFQAIYFNAWEDDFCDDPLVAIIGQLSDHLSKDKEFEERGQQIREVIEQNLRSLLKKHAGVTLPEFGDKILKEYADQRTSKDELKKGLKRLSDEVWEKSKHPLIFIIDELDRCRPTFAVELLERVKHVFDVPCMVFVFGINRDELCSSVQSIYGNINSDVYLRRFFDMEFLLQEANSETFCNHLIERYRLEEFFSELSKRVDHSVHRDEFSEFSNFFPRFCGLIGLSLRDIDYCFRTIIFVGKNLPERYRMYPDLLSALIPLRLKNHNLYRRFVQGEPIGAEVMTCIEQWLRDKKLSEELSRYLNWMEIYLYATYNSYTPPYESESFRQLKLLSQGKPLTSPEALSERTRNSSKERADQLCSIAGSIQRSSFSNNLITMNTIRYLASLIELTKLDHR